MASIDVKLNSEGVRELLKSPEVAKLCESLAAKMSRATGVNYVPDVYTGRNRVNAGAKTWRGKK